MSYEPYMTDEEWLIEGIIRFGCFIFGFVLLIAIIFVVGCSI